MTVGVAIGLDWLPPLTRVCIIYGQVFSSRLSLFCVQLLKEDTHARSKLPRRVWICVSEERESVQREDAQRSRVDLGICLRVLL